MTIGSVRTSLYNMRQNTYAISLVDAEEGRFVPAIGKARWSTNALPADDTWA
jgi:hypothetical protein